MKLSDPLGDLVPSRFVALTWFIPSFVSWQLERCVQGGYDELKYHQAANRLEALLHQLLGVP